MYCAKIVYVIKMKFKLIGGLNNMNRVKKVSAVLASLSVLVSAPVFASTTFPTTNVKNIVIANYKAYDMKDLFGTVGKLKKAEFENVTDATYTFDGVKWKSLNGTDVGQVPEVSYDKVNAVAIVSNKIVSNATYAPQCTGNLFNQAFTSEVTNEILLTLNPENENKTLSSIKNAWVGKGFLTSLAENICKSTNLKPTKLVVGAEAYSAADYPSQDKNLAGSIQKLAGVEGKAFDQLTLADLKGKSITLHVSYGNLALKPITITILK
jgi:hypothetical protein